jgi:hypothetical protein
MSTSKVTSAPENKGVMTQEHFKMLFPTFTLSYTSGAVTYYEHEYTIDGDILRVYKVPKESWLRPKLEAIYRNWLEIQVHAEK